MYPSFRQTCAALLATFCLSLGPSRPLQARDILFGATGGATPSNLYILNPANGSVVSTVGPIGSAVTGMAFDPTSGVLYGVTSGVSAVSPRSLITINSTTGTGILVGPEVNGTPVADMTFTKNGRIFGWGEGGDDLYTINKATGTATKVGESGIGTYGSGISANSRDVLFYTGGGNSGLLRTIDKTTGLPTTVATLNGAPGANGDPVNALAFNSKDILYGSIGTFGPAQGHLVIIDTTSGAVTDLGLTVSQLDAIAFLSSNDPEEFAAIYEVGFAQATTLALNLERRMDDIRAGSRSFCPPKVIVPSGKDYSDGKEMADGKVVLPKAEAPPVVEVESRWSVFALATGQFIDVDDSGRDRPGFDIAMGGFTIGLDYRVCKNFAIGLYGEYAHSDVDFDDQLGGLSDGSLEVESGKLGIYATWFSGGLYLQGAAGGGFNSYDTHRADFFGPEDGTTDGTEFSAFIATGYDWHVGCFVFGPTASLQYTTIQLNSFIEDRSSILALEFPDQSQESLRSTVGLHAAYDWRLFGLHWRSEYRAAWKHEFDDTAYGIDSRFALRALGTSLLTVRGPDVGRDSALVSSGTTILWNDRVATYLNFDSEYGRKNYDNQSVSAGIRVLF